MMNHSEQTASEKQTEKQQRKQQAEQQRKQPAEQQREWKCEASFYGMCGGHENVHEVVWHVRPRHKDCDRGHGSYDTTLPVWLCAKHSERIRIAADNNGRLPELYGWDKWDALDGLTAKLEYVGYHPVFCAACDFRQKATVSETGACTKTCKLLSQLSADWDHCDCAKPVVCICESFGNNKLHWGILSYGNGFSYEYDCPACVRPCWRDEHTQYKYGLTSVERMLEIAKTDPRLIYQKNANGITPLQLIRPLIQLLLDTRKDEYVKYAEQGWAGHNAGELEIIETELGGHPLTPAQQGEGRMQQADAEDQDECEDAGVLWWS